MRTISAKDVMGLTLQRFPGFRSRWESHLFFWGGEVAGLGNDMGAFSDYVAGLIREGEFGLLPAIFTFVEDLLANGDEQIKTVTTTCFLENLMNDRVDPKSFVPLLGPRSREFCRRWDEFTGVRTEGL